MLVMYSSTLYTNTTYVKHMYVRQLASKWQAAAVDLKARDGSNLEKREVLQGEDYRYPKDAGPPAIPSLSNPKAKRVGLGSW